MSLSQHTIDEVKNRIDIVEVIGDFVHLKRSGQNYKALSPFTNEKTPSFFVVPSKGIFKCFSSGKGGDAISFLMEYDGLSYIEAIRYLAEKYGIEIVEEDQTDEQLEAQNERESIYIVLRFALEYFSENLWKTDEGKSIGLSYFRERGFPEEIIQKFSLGFAVSKWDGLLTAAKEKGFSEDILEKAGLILKKETRVYDRFRGRTIFPIFNLSGKPIAFGARALKKEDQPKYINSPETVVYHKSKTLYGLNLAKNAIRTEDNCFMVEGYTDVISLHQVGIENVVSSSGTSLTEEQIRLIARYTQNVTVLFDGDPAGIKASLRGIDMILEGGLNVKAVVLPEGEDPDSYSKKLGSDAFRDYLTDHAQDFIGFKIELFSEEAQGDPVKKAASIRQIVESIARIPDSIKRTVYIKDASERLGIEEQVLVSEQNKFLLQYLKNKPQRASSAPETPIPLPEEPAEQPVKELKVSDLIYYQERESIRLLIRYGYNRIEDEFTLHEYLFEELDDIEFTHPVYREIIRIFRDELEKGNVVDPDFLLANGSEEVKKEVVDLLSEKDTVSDHWMDRYRIFVPKEEDTIANAIFTNVLRLRQRVMRKLIEDNKEKLKDTRDPDQQDELLRVHLELKKYEKDIAERLGNIIF